MLLLSHTALSGSASAATSPGGRGLGRPVLAVLDEQGLVFAQAAGLRWNGQRLRTLPALPEFLRGESRNAKSPQHSLRAFGVSSKRKEVNEMNE